MIRERAKLNTVAGAVLMAAAMIAGAAASQAPALAAVNDVIVTQPFVADSGDECLMGFTKGTLGWHIGSPRIVDVRGVVADRPLPSAPDNRCRDDGRFTVATFTGYAQGSAVGSEIRRADNGQQDVSFSLTGARPIDVMVVQVCRHPVRPGPAVYCGSPQKFRAPVTIAG